MTSGGIQGDTENEFRKLRFIGAGKSQCGNQSHWNKGNVTPII